MSAFMEASYGVLAPYLCDFGYSPVPIKPGGKAPMLPDWQAGHPPEHWLPHCAGWGVGILTRTCPAIDIDVRDRTLVRALVQLADRLLLACPFRIGARPKVLLPFFSHEPFGKIASRWFALPGEDWRLEGFQPHRVEVLGDGQQFVAYARHPGTGRPYRWGRGEPMQFHLNDLPELNAEAARGYVQAAERLVFALGGVPVRKRNGQWQHDTGEPERTTPPRPSGWRNNDARWRDLPAEVVARIIDPQGARKTRRGWDCRCPVHNGVGHTSLGITKGRDGRLIVNCFADCEFRDIAAAIEDLVVGRAAA